ncbi:MAG: FkbM family methyltransferase [Sedimenticola sp.]
MIYRLLGALSRYIIAIENLGFIPTIELIKSRVFPNKKNSEKIFRTKKFGDIHWRTKGDWVISHLYTPQIEIYSPSDNISVNTIFDLGANIGIETLRFNKMYNHAFVVAVEAESKNYQQLLKNTESHKNITAVHAAIWNKEANLKIESSSENNQTFCVREVENGDIHYHIIGKSLMSIMSEHGVEEIDVLKIDIEGAESVLFDKSCDAWIGFVKCFVIECPDSDEPFTMQKIFHSLIRNKINVNTYVNGENIVMVRDDLDWKPKNILHYQ